MKLKTVLATSALVLAGSVSQLSADYYIPNQIQDGVILHCFCWPLRDVIDELPAIADAGFGAIQLSPMQAPNVAGQPWYYFYAPCDYRFYDNVMGSRADMIELCEKASAYGIKIVMDICANHIMGSEPTNPWRAPEQWGDPWWFEFEDERVVADQGVVKWDTRWSETHQNPFGWEIRTDNPEVQLRMKAYLADLYSMGVRGVRWDSCKHVGVPSEGDDFWAQVIPGSKMWHYGEILGSPHSHSELMKEYAHYMSVTDPGFGGYWEHNGRHWEGVPRNKCVFWAESHDTFSNDQVNSQLMTDADIDRSWALVASRQGASALYLSRPGLLPKDDIKLAVKGSMHFTVPQVKWVNRFHNVMGNNPEAFWRNDDVTAVYRVKGAVLVAQEGRTVDIPSGNLEVGQYTDQVTGNQFTVAGGKIKGTIGESGIAVVYNPELVTAPVPEVSIEPATLLFKAETADYTLTLSGGSKGSYSVDGSEYVDFSDPVTVTIGEGVEYGKTIHIDWRAENSVYSEAGSFDILKRDPSFVSHIYARSDANQFDGLKVYTFIYGANGNNGNWPGEEMTFNPNLEINGLRGWYEYEVPVKFELDGRALVSTSGSPRYPADGVPGIEISGGSLVFTLAGNNWIVTQAEYSPTISEISEIESEDKYEPSYYNLQGIKLSSAPTTPGIYIIRKNGVASKFLLRK